MLKVTQCSWLDGFTLLQVEDLKCTIVAVLVLLCSMVPLFVKDGLLVPYTVTSLAFVFLSIRLLSALDRCSEAELRLGAYRKLLFCLPKLDLACVVRWKVSVRFSTHSQNTITWFICGSLQDAGPTLCVGKTSEIQVYINSVLSHAPCNTAEIIII